MDKYKILITGVNYNSVEIHVIDFLKNQYINRFFVLGEVEKVIEKIKMTCNIYDCNDLILDYKSLSSVIIKKMEKEGLIVGVV